jgi:hypothetical protein
MLGGIDIFDHMRTLMMIIAGTLALLFAGLSAGLFSGGTASSVLPGLLFAGLSFACIAAAILGYRRPNA